MKHLRGLFALTLAGAMAFGQVPAIVFAEDTPVTATEDSGVNPTDKGSITISNPVKGVTYNAYKMLDLASFSDSDVSTGKHATDAYSYVIHKDSKWLGFFTTAGNAGATYFDVDQNNPVKLLDSDTSADYYIVTPKTGSDLNNPFADTGTKDETTNSGVSSSSLVQKFAQDALAYAKAAGNQVAVDATATATSTDSLSLGTDLNLGYYLVDTSAGTLCALDTTNKATTVYEKNDLPTVDKLVQEDRRLTNDKLGDLTTAYQEVDDATVGDTVYYKTVINVEKGAQNYVLHDIMEAGLTFNSGSLKVWFVPNGGDTTTKTTSGQYKWVELAADAAVAVGGTTYKDANPALADFYDTTTATGDTFTVSFNNEFLTFLSDRIGASSEDFATASADTTAFVVEYTATLNENAEVKSANTNETYLQYGDKVTGVNETTKQYTDTYTWPIQVFKFTDDGAGATSETKTPLAGAVFELYENEDHTGRKFKFVQLKSGDAGYDSGQSNIPQYMVVSDSATVGESKLDFNGNTSDKRDVVDSITTDSTGKFIIAGLDGEDEDYYLHELTAPKGYNRLAYDVKVTVGSTGVTSSAKAVSESGTEQVHTVVYANKDNAGTGAAYGSDSSDVSASNIPVLNNTGTELPSTGGIGTTIFYVVGGILVAGAAVTLVVRRRAQSEA